MSEISDIGLGLLALSVTGDCNLRCAYCYASGGESRTGMSWQSAKRAIDIACKCFSAFKVQFTGGEPLMNLDLIEKAVAYIEDLGLKAPYQLQTNATLITPEIANRLKGMRMAIGVSLDGPASINDRIRPFSDGRGSTGAALSGIFCLRDAGIRIGATTVLSRDNAMQLSGLVDLFSYAGNIEGIAVDFLRPAGRASRFMQPEAAQAAIGVEAAICRARHLATLGGRVVKFRELERMKSTIEGRGKRQHHCYFDSCRSLVVLPDGRAYACPSLINSEMMLGRVDDPFFEKGILQRMAEARSLVCGPEQCLSCEERWLCSGPCLAHYSLGKNLEIECAVKRVFMRHALQEDLQD